MGKHFALALQLPSYRQEQQQLKAKVQRKPLGAPRLLGPGIAVMAVAALLFYLFQVNSFSTAGYEINRLQNQLDDLKSQQQKLEFQAAQLQSIQRIETDPSVLNMVPVQNVSYIQPASSLSQR